MARASRCCGLIALVGLTSSSLHAEPTAADKATAESLFVEGRRLLAAGKYAEACPKFAESQQIDSGLGTLLNLGDCYEKNGQTASAWASFREAASTAARSSDSREKVARDRAAAL